MEVAFISEFISDELVFKIVDKDDKNNTVQAGSASPIEETYCKKIADNKLDPITNDAKNNPITKVMRQLKHSI